MSAPGMGAVLQLQIGTELRAAPRQMTRERMRWHVDAQPTIAVDDGRIHTQPPTIHDDDAYARSQGLTGIIADGMISTNWSMGLLLDVFGRDAAGKGKLKTRYIRPIYEDETVLSCARVRAIERNSEREVTYHLDVWCEVDGAVKATVGEAVVIAKAR